MKQIKTILFLALLTITQTVQAQGPPIQTDTPIMLGLAGRGVRTFVKIIRKATLRNDGDKVSDPQNRKVTAWVTSVAFPYNLFSDRFQLGIIVPLINSSLEAGDQEFSGFGIGDVRFFAKYLLLQVDRKQETFRLAAKSGIKLATGDEEENPARGSGSTDYFFSTVAGWIKNRIGVYLEGIYSLNTSRNQIDFGNSFSYNLAFGYRLLPTVYQTYPSPQLNGFLEINGNTSAKNKVNDVTNEDSGGTTIFLSPGLQYVGGRRWLVETSLQIPIVNHPNGVQLATDWTVLIGTRILLF